MTLPQVVQENVGWLDSRGRDDAWTSVRAHLMSQEEVIRAKDAQIELANAKVLVAESRVTDAAAELHRLTEIAEGVEPLVIRLGEVTEKLETANALLRGEATLLRAWARESRDGGWSTHQVNPMNRRADEIDKHLQGAGDE